MAELFINRAGINPECETIARDKSFVIVAASFTRLS